MKLPQQRSNVLVECVPCYYEWHLQDDAGRMLFNIIDPCEELDGAKTLEDVSDFVQSLFNLEGLRRDIICPMGEDISPEDLDLPSQSLEVIANALYSYYIVA